MFEVDWTDYDRELVGERKARKEIQKDRKKKEEPHSGRNSISTRSSSSSNEKSLGFLSSIVLKKRQNPVKNKKALSSATLQSPQDDRKSIENLDRIPEIPTDISVSTRLSLTDSESKAPSSPAPLPPSRVTSCSENDWKENWENSLRDSMFSKLTEVTTSPPAAPFGSSAAECSPTKAIQVLGTDSYVTQTTDVSYERRKWPDREESLTKITIRANPPELQAPALLTLPLEETMAPIYAQEVLPFIQALNKTKFIAANEVKLNLRMDEKPLLSSDGDSRTSSFNQHSVRPLFTKSPQQNKRRSTTTTTPSLGIKFQIDNPDAWRPPDAWECCQPTNSISQATEELRRVAELEEAAGCSITMDLPAMQRELRRMAAASPQIMLARLTEKWGHTPDAAFYKELEMEKKRWMLSALYNLDRPREEQFSIDRPTSPQCARILALFETKATASYLAALHMPTPITHLASSTLSNSLFPNVLPLISPVASNATVSLARNSFTAVHCLSLPSIVASPEIPRLLKSIHRCLAPAGILHLALVDPLPVASTLGPRMRAWLDNNLMLNLEKNFRCASPSKLFPGWLADSGLRGGGSSIIKMKFRAIPPSPPADDDNIASAGPEAEGDERRIRAELRSVVGRMLWREAWGQYVNADSWWWEDRECELECLQLCTHWEYSVIEGVKDAD